MLDTQMKAQLQAYLQNLRQPIRLVASLDGSDKSAEMRELLTDIAELSDKVSFEDNGADQRVPSFVEVLMAPSFTGEALQLLQSE